MTATNNLKEVLAQTQSKMNFTGRSGTPNLVRPETAGEEIGQLPEDAAKRWMTNA